MCVAHAYSTIDIEARHHHGQKDGGRSKPESQAGDCQWHCLDCSVVACQRYYSGFAASKNHAESPGVRDFEPREPAKPGRAGFTRAPSSELPTLFCRPTDFPGRHVDANG